MKYRLIAGLLALALLGTLAACGAAEDALENKIDAIEDRIDAAEDAVEDRVNDAANALTPSTDAAANFTPVDPAELISPEDAETIALAHAGLAVQDVVGLHTVYQLDDGRQEYEVEFRHGHIEYEYEIDAATGDIISWDKGD